jgi:hypothetical protein
MAERASIASQGRRRARVCAVMQVRDEWPLVSVSITHALTRHADEVYVLDHASVDGTREGLRALARRWPGRLHVLEYHGEEFWQEACLSTLLAACAASSPDWIYALDADEFLLTRDPHSSLGDVLSAVDDDCVAVRYEIENWVAPHGFDDTDVASYTQLRYRSRPSVFHEVPKSVLVDQIAEGVTNYFDVPFQSKIVFRAGRVPWVVAGTHDLKDFLASSCPEVTTDAFRVAHLPLLSRDRIGRRAQHGRRADAAGGPTDIGWQSRLVWALSRDDRLDEFWRRHSVPRAGDDVPEAALPVTVRDDSLAEALEPSILLLQEGGGEPAPGSAAADLAFDGASDARVGFEAAVRVVRDLQVIADELARRNEELQSELDGSRAQCECLRHETDDLRAALARQQREAEESRQALAMVARSRSWRVLAPVRAAARIVRSLARRTRA